MGNVAPGSPDSGEFWAYTLQLPRDERAVRVARVTLRAVLDTYDLGKAKDLAVLLASELVTNAMRYSDGPAWMRLSKRDETLVRIAVWDSNPTIPGPFLDCLDPPPAALKAEEGRGLLLVRQCADAWGGHVLGEQQPFGPVGKVLWFEVGARTAWV
jgi:anti-sigma regulatory factor (Ser/Thr protein kinase)